MNRRVRSATDRWIRGLRAARRMEPRSIGRQIVTYAISLAVLLLAWEIASLVVNRSLPPPTGGIQHAKILPGPFEALSQLVKNAAELQRHFLSSAWRLLLAMLIALFTAVPIGLALGRERGLDRYLSPIVYITYPIPQVALILFFFVVFGTGSATKVAMVALVLFFQILVSARGAAKNIDEEHITSVLSAGASRWQVYRHVILPATLPDVLTSLRVSIGLGMAFLYIAETSAAFGKGLGGFIKDRMLFQREQAFAGIIAMAILGLGLYVAVDIVERIVCRWKHVRRRPS